MARLVDLPDDRFVRIPCPTCVCVLDRHDCQLLGDIHTGYVYDTDTADPSGWAYPTKNNRLLSYEVRSGSATGTLLRTVKYIYYKTGDVCNISLKDEYQGSGDANAYNLWYDLAFYMFTNGGVAMIANGTFVIDPNTGLPSGYQRTAAREFAYDDPRERWLGRELNPSTLAPLSPQSWTDYVGAMPWGDFDVTLSGSTPVATEQVRYLGTAAQQDAAGSNTRYLHGDLIDSTVMTTDPNGVPIATLAYTAFGEPIGDPNLLGTRYRYAGGWGYESGFVTLVGVNPNLPPITLQHVGARWYQPDVARFAQRDPTGIQCDLNT